jgi:hypothetical protein
VSTSNLWWKDTPKPHEDVFQYVKYLDSDQSYKQSDNFKHMRLYGSYEMNHLRSYQQLRTESVSVQNRVTLNVIQSMIDTVVSKITKNRPKPTFLTDGGDFSQQRRAEKLTQFIEGQFQATDFYAKSALAFLDSCIFGTGALKIFRGGKDNSEIKVERIFIDEIRIDDRESFYGEPRQMHQIKFIHKDVLKEMFPDRKTEIEMVGADNSAYSPYPKQNIDMIMVVESWHLKSGPDATDGKHMISIESATLFEEEYDKEYFPFVFWRWGLRPLGFFGQGLSEQLSGLQLEINKILRTIQVIMHLGVPKVFVEASSKVVTSHLDNKIGAIIKYAGTKPEEGRLISVPPELFNHLDRLYSRAYEIAGISQLSAQAQKPAGLDSGKALREFNDLETERFMSVAQRYEKTFLDAAKIMIHLAKEIAEDTKNFSVKVKGKKFLRTIKWKEVDMDEDQYVMTVFPTSALSSTPAARLQDVQELIQAGFVSKEDAMRLLDFPDLQAFYNYSTASGEDIMNLIEGFIEEGKYQTPEPFQNLVYGREKMQMAYLHFKANNAPDEKLELFRRWIQEADDLLRKSEAEAVKQQIAAQNAVQQASAEQLAAEEAAQGVDTGPVDPLMGEPTPEDAEAMGLM